MIKSLNAISAAESLEYIKDGKDGEHEVKVFIKKFVKTSPKDAKEMRKALEALDLIKMRPEHIAKIIDTNPEDAESLNRIFTDVGLDEDESKKILEAISGFK